MRWIETTLIAVTFSVCSSGCVHAKPRADFKPNLLYVFSDQQRRHAVGFMNEDPVITPNIDKLAAEGVAFTKAICSSPICTPARGSLLTGMYPHSNGVLMNNNHLTHEYETFGDVLKKGGYQTGYIGKWHLWKQQFVPPEERHGFDFWHANNYNGDHFLCRYWRDSEKPYVDKRGWNVTHETDVAIEFIEGALKKEAPFALFVSHHPPHSNSSKSLENATDLTPHKPIQGEHFKRDVQYVGPEEFFAMYRDKTFIRRPNVPPNANGGDAVFASEACAGYFGMVSAVDHDFGRLLKALDRPDPRNPGLTLKETTIVVYTSDHGEMLGSHELMFKDIFYEESISVPFVISWPAGGIERGKRCDHVFNTVDVMPTILNLMKLPIPATVQGTDFTAALTGKKFKAPYSAYTSYFTGWWDKDTYGPTDGYWRAVRTDRYTYAVGRRTKIKTEIVGAIYNVPRELGDGPEGEWVEFLFDNEKDPYQMDPIVAGRSAEYDRALKELRAELKAYLVQTNDPWKDEATVFATLN